MRGERCCKHSWRKFCGLSMDALKTLFAGCLVFLLLALFLSGSHAYDVDYTGDKVFEIEVRNGREWSILKDIMSSHTLSVELWKQPLKTGDPLHLHVSNSVLNEVVDQFRMNNLQYTVLIDNLQKLIDDETNSLIKTKARQRRAVASGVSNALIGTYATLDETYTWLRQLKVFFGDITDLFSIGTTFENRNIMMLKIGIKQNYRKPAIFIDSATHAREWISPASINYIIYLLYDGYQRGDADIVRLLSNLDWYFMPVANPDGYVHSHTKVRLWRKNRAQYPLDPESPACYGVDINRNFPYHWAEDGSSNIPCSVVYHGPSAGSELETQAFMDFLLEHNDTITATLSVHSYSQLFLTRYAYTNSTFPADHDHLLQVNKEIAAAINETNGEWYKYGIAPDILCGSADWIKDIAGIKYAYTTELRDKGQYGFILPIDYIPLVAEELWSGIQVLAKYAAQVPVPQYSTTSREDTSSAASTRPPSTTRSKTASSGVPALISHTSITFCLLSSHFLLNVL